MPELLGMCDRIYVMSEGKFVGELSGEEATQEKIMSMIINVDNYSEEQNNNEVGKESNDEQQN